MLDILDRGSGRCKRREERSKGWRVGEVPRYERYERSGQSMSLSS